MFCLCSHIYWELSEEVKYKIGVYKSINIGYTLTVFVHMMDSNTLCF